MKGPAFNAQLAISRAHITFKKTQYRKFKTNTPSKGIARPQSQFPHSCICERFIYSHDRSAYSAAGKYVDRSWEYINRSQGLEAHSFSRNTLMGFSLQCVTLHCCISPYWRRILLKVRFLPGRRPMHFVLPNWKCTLILKVRSDLLS